jgi:hypothetical protein
MTVTTKRRLVEAVLGATLAFALVWSEAQVTAGPGSAGDGSGGPAVAHHADGKVVKSGPLTHDVPDPALYRIGYPAVEPTLGRTKKGNVFYTAFQSNTRIEVVKSSDEGKTWEVVSPKFPNGRNAQLLSFDPYLYVDKYTSRVYTIDLTVACAYLSYTDDEAKSWTTNPLACGRPVNDHQTLFSGPPAVSPTAGYPNIVYYCWNDVGSSSCGKSLNGGITFAPTGSPAFGGYDPDAGDPESEDPQDKFCGGLHGHGFVGPDGTVYLPKGHCGDPWLAISKDEGMTWTRVRIATNGVAHHEAGVVADAKGNVYYLWVARDRLPYLAVSKDGGETWSDPMMIGSPGVKESNLPGIDIGGTGKIAIVYMGSENSPGKPFPRQPECTAIQACPAPKGYDNVTWNGYMTITTTALDKNPVFYSATVNDPKDPLIRQNCGPGRCRAAYDFIDIIVDRDGSVWGAFVDGCISICSTTGPNNTGEDGVVGRLIGGPSLK